MNYKVFRRVLFSLLGVGFAASLVIAVLFSQKDAESVGGAPAGKKGTIAGAPVSSLLLKDIPSTPAFEPPVRALTYNLLQEFTLLDATNVAQNFIAVVGSEQKNTETSLWVISGSQKSEVFYMHLPSGSFVFHSAKGVLLTSSGNDERAKVEELVRRVWNDTTVQIVNVYESSDMPGTRIYEARRDWDKVGLPIVNISHLLTVPGEKQVGDMSLLDFEKTVGSTMHISRINFARIGIKDGRIVSVVSTIRPSRTEGESTSAHIILSYPQAVKNLQNISNRKIYTSPQHDASSLQEVTLREAFLAYPEELPSRIQRTLSPTYLFRGTGTTKDGTRVPVVMFTSAIDDTKASSSYGPFTKDHGLSRSQQQGTLAFVDPDARSDNKRTGETGSSCHAGWNVGMLSEMLMTNTASASAVLDEFEIMKDC